MVDVEVPDELRRPEVIRDALAGRIDQLPPSAALAILADLSIDESEHRRMLHEAVEDRDLDPQVRALAVLGFANLDTESAIAEVVGVLEQPNLEEEVASRAVTLLGRTGGPEHMDRLDAVKRSAVTEVLRNRAAFAQVLIAHRFQLTAVSADLPAVESQPEPENAGALPFISRRLGDPRRRRAVESIQRTLPDVAPTDYDAYELQCGPRLMVVIVRAGLATSEEIQKLGERPALAAVIAFVNDETGNFFPALFVLTRPSASGRISLLITRLTGEPVFLGEGSVESSRADIELASAQTPGVAPIRARVHISDNKLEIAGVSARRAAPGRMPERIQMPTSE